MSTLFDVAVIGAGPAGNRVAQRLAAAGVSVAVVEHRPRVGDKVCTGIVSGECLRASGVEGVPVFHRARSARFVSPAGQEVRAERPEPLAYVVDRVALVQGLAERARQAGARFIAPARAVDLERVDGHFRLRLEGRGVPPAVGARVVVLASGFGSRLALWAGLGRLGDYIVGAQVEVEAPDLEEIEVYLGQWLAPGFFAWLVPTRPGRALAGLFARQGVGRHLGRFLEWLQGQGRVGQATGPVRAWAIPLAPPPHTVGEGVLAVGDAAGQVKPTTGGGIHYSLLCADLAGEVLVRAFARNDLSSTSLARYERAWRRALGPELALGRWARRLYARLSDEALEWAFRRVMELGVAQEVARWPHLSFDWHAPVLAWGLRHPSLGAMLLRLAWQAYGVPRRLGRGPARGPWPPGPAVRGSGCRWPGPPSGGRL